MSLSLLSIPKLPYIVFELISIPIEKTLNGSVTVESQGNPVVVDTVIMDVLPSKINYGYSSKKNYNAGVGDGNVNVIKGGLAPQRIMLEGTFGKRFIRRGAKIQDGFGRLKEFRNLFIKSQSISTIKSDDPNKKRSIPAMNFYDFTIHYWGAADLDTFEIDEDAQRFNTLPTYKVQLTGMGSLIQVRSTDPLLRNLQYAIKLQETFDAVNEEIQNSDVFRNANEVAADLETLKLATNGANELVGQYAQALTTIPIVGNLLGTGLGSSLNDPVGLIEKSIIKFADLL